MSTATPFVAIGSFPYCPTAITVDSPGYESPQYIGPMSLSEAMAIYWNLESATFSINGRSVAITAQYGGATFPIPRERVCQPYEWQSSETWPDDEYAWCEILTTIGTSSSSYYVGVVAYYFAPSAQSAHLTTLSKYAPGPDWTAAATYSGTVLGKSATFYRYWFADYYPTYGGTDNATVSPIYYTY